MAVAVILAAGSSSRMGGGIKKEFMAYKGKPLLYHGVETFVNTGLFEKILIPCRGDLMDETKLMLSGLRNLEFIEGGATRQLSVLNSLVHLEKDPPDIVLIHDGARPFVSSGTIEGVYRMTRDRGACIPVEPATNTMKIIDGEGKIVSHLKRDYTRGAQTPQGFRFAGLLEAHRAVLQAQEEFTDDSEIWDAHIGPVYTVEGNLENDKITYRSDLDSLGIHPEVKPWN
jgi:2-C-methyl-D-erythritol 4-phosphate cytidylyltransferase